jgi:hypothetical protein
LNTIHIEDQFVNIFNRHESKQKNMNSKPKAGAKVEDELNQSNENSDTK